MHGEIVHYRPYFGIGADIARYAAPESEVLPSQGDVRARLQEAFAALQARDQQHNDIVAEYIRTCQDWSTHTRGGSTHNHYTIDTHVLNDDGSAVYIEIDCAFPAARTEPHGTAAREQIIRDHMLSLATPRNEEKSVTEQDVIAFVVSNAERASIRYYTAEAIHHLQDSATEGTGIRGILRGQYHSKTIVEEVFCGTGDKIWARGPASNWITNEYVYHVSPAGIVLRGEVRAEDIDTCIVSAQNSAASNAVEKATHGDEYRGLFNKYKYDSDLSGEERQKIAGRMQEIVVANGYPDAHFGDALLVATLHLNGLRDAPEKAKTLWDQSVLHALREGLQDDMYLYLRNVEARHQAAQTIQTLRLAGKNESSLDHLNFEA